MPYSPLGRGFLAGAVDAARRIKPGDYRLHDPRYDDGNFDANLRIVDVLKAIAATKAVSAAQIALAWLLAQADDIVPIPGCKRRLTLEDSMSAADVVLSASDLARLDEAAPRGRTAGPRYGARLMQTVEL